LVLSLSSGHIQKALQSFHASKLRVIIVDKNPTYLVAIIGLKKASPYVLTCAYP